VLLKDCDAGAINISQGVELNSSVQARIASLWACATAHTGMQARRHTHCSFMKGLLPAAVHEQLAEETHARRREVKP
jgi:hypothetical protein